MPTYARLHKLITWLILCAIYVNTCLKSDFNAKLSFKSKYGAIRGEVEDTRLEAKAKDTKKSEAKAEDSPSEDRLSRGQRLNCSRPRTQAQVFSKKRRSKIFLGDLQNFNDSKNIAVLEPRTGQFSRT